MNRKIWPLALILALLACRPSETAQRQPSALLPPDPAPQSADLTVDQLVARYEAARGGEDKLKNIKSVKMSGRMATRDNSASPVTTMIAPGRYLRRIEQAPGSILINAVDGPATWEVSPRTGILKPTPMSAKDAARFRHFADPQGALVDHQAKGNQLELVGKQSWQGTQVYKLKVTFGDGGVHYLYLDAQSFLPVRLVSSLYVPPLGKDIDVEFVYEEYRDVEGIKWPMVEKGSAPEVNFVQTISWDKIEVNPPFDDSAFKAPQS
jgi:hypothetical protein